MASKSHADELKRIFPGSSEMAHRMRSVDWSQTALGPPETWPLNLRTSVRIILTSRQPMFVWWGKELVHLYNDGYISILGAKHPAALAQTAPVVWSEVWDVAGPRAEFAMSQDEGTYDEALPFIMLRNGYPEETYVTFSYSPIPDDQGGFGGILCPAAEDTQRIIGERQMALLRELPAKTADARTWRDACRLAARAIETNPNDLPFALIYSMERKGGSPSLAATSGIADINNSAPEALTLRSPARWPLDEVCGKRSACLVSDLTSVSDAPPLVLGYPVRQAIALPIALSGEVDTNAVLVVGLNPLRPFDDNYQNFVEMVAAGILAAMVNAESYEAERRRAEALADLDRAKTAFFSNVGHEFRTPLTLLLGPLEDELRERETSSERLTIAHHGALRLLKLVNTLLDFSRIEAGRIEASYEPTDLGALTTELASVFRSAIERAGLRLSVDCPRLPEDVYVDREMWEKIVLNLLSNAFKFTFQGEISVKLIKRDRRVELSVTDTGVGISPSELRRAFLSAFTAFVARDPEPMRGPASVLRSCRNSSGCMVARSLCRASKAAEPPSPLRCR
jgi:signal transduction histidine kinase